ncbi:MAG: carboxylating nicotinate-nucleotide diphosphorylase [Planctomycetes bacterium]|nr:carboxylating nicotinate-nucleotide diphosphorylase [Planctomycetota bacterium]
MQDLNALSLSELFLALTADGSLDRLLSAARAEDLADTGDVTTQSIIHDEWDVRAAGVARQAGTVAGLAVIPRLLEVFECDVRFESVASDGEACAAGQVLWRLLGDLRPILAVERTMLNLIGRLSGIATLTRRYVEAIAGTTAVICDTRKTTPGMRFLEKYAVRCGGGTLHRLGLHDAVLFKDNHLQHLGPGEFAPTVAAAAKAARDRYDLRFVEVEIDTLEQLRLVLEIEPGLIDMVLLDNMSLDQMRDAVISRDKLAPEILLEASGSITLDTVRAVAETGVDRISVGALTHSAACLDIGLDLA